MNESPSPRTRRQLLWSGLRWGLVLLVVIAVGWQSYKLVQGIDWRTVTIRPGWLTLSIILYVLGWVPSVWFWRELLRTAGTPVDWLTAFRAYYCGHLGKYVPGKASVLVIRAGMIHSRGVPISTGVLSSAHETLTSMAAGGVIGVALLPHVLPTETWKPWLGESFAADWVIHLFPVVVLGICLAGLPVLSLIFSKVLAKLRRGDRNATPPDWSRQPSYFSFGLLLVGWLIMGLSLGCTIQSLSPESVDFQNWPRWTAACSLCIVLGFMALFAPGGIGIREWILLELLQPELGPLAVIVAGVSRLTWLTGEVVAAGILYYWPGTRCTKAA